MKLEIDALCHKGLVRDNNEDMLTIGGMMLRDNTVDVSLDTPEEGSFYLLVADGMGGHDNGEEASEYTLTRIKEQFDARCISADTFEDDIRSVVRDTASRLNRRAAEQGQQYPMGCTLTGVVWNCGNIWLINAGDSRTYRFRGGILRQLTTDETERGFTGNPNADKRLLNCVGGSCEGLLTISSMDGKLLEDDILLICSDGLSDMATDEQIEAALADGATAADLYRMACEGGGVDNVSIILAKIK